MNLEVSVTALQAKNLQLVQENDQLKFRVGLLKENVGLKARLSRDTLGDFTGTVSVTSRWLPLKNGFIFIHWDILLI